MLDERVVRCEACHAVHAIDVEQPIFRDPMLHMEVAEDHSMSPRNR